MSKGTGLSTRQEYDRAVRWAPSGRARTCRGAPGPRPLHTGHPASPSRPPEPQFTLGPQMDGLPDIPGGSVPPPLQDCSHPPCAPHAPQPPSCTLARPGLAVPRPLTPAPPRSPPQPACWGCLAPSPRHSSRPLRHSRRPGSPAPVPHRVLPHLCHPGSVASAPLECAQAAPQARVCTPPCPAPAHLRPSVPHAQPTQILSNLQLQPRPLFPCPGAQRPVCPDDRRHHTLSASNADCSLPSALPTPRKGPPPSIPSQTPKGHGEPSSPLTACHQVLAISYSETLDMFPPRTGPGRALGWAPWGLWSPGWCLRPFPCQGSGYCPGRGTCH